MTWRIERHLAAAGEHGSTQRFVDQAFALFDARSEAGEPGPSVEVPLDHANGDNLVL